MRSRLVVVRGAGIESAVWTAAAGDLRGAKAVGFCLGASVAEESSTFAWLFQSPRKHALAECTAELAECILAVRSLSMLKTSQSSFPRTKENPTLLLVHDTLLHQGMPAIPSGASLTPSILSCPSSSCFDFLHPLVSSASRFERGPCYRTALLPRLARCSISKMLPVSRCCIEPSPLPPRRRPLSKQKQKDP